ncbi:peptidoglycan D,D-transpeptidase FtsI family protein [Streptomyces profundus]|uniref:peptidoglycan D,D-transpeptidase FtsI family protein n=1 Tax=Streptomyces profundus TaxID=2867410 RepID=UPI001D163630|nr:penicillin-binding protein 2 [Streptomyces sp. MA3_2.13]UED85262.1 penicillin-binding protein 2 [Streptomyces sp. MA3_2.13]
MNKPMRRVAVFCGVLILALLVRVNYVQFVQADELQSHEDNRRVRIERYANPRGDIIVDGQPITGSEETNDDDFTYKRTWVDGEMWAPVTGYSSQAFGTTQLEYVNDSILTGDDDRMFFNNTIDMITGKDQRGGDVITTLNGDAQLAAFEGLGDRKGAVVALDPRRGAILALASTPSYDPSSFAGYADSDAEAWTALEGHEDKPMLNRALRETYPPGSTFKVLTAAAALEHGEIDNVDDPTEYEDPYILPDTQDVPLTNQVPGVCEEATVRDAMRYSCNSVFAGLSNDVGNEGMIETAEAFGFNEEHFVPVRADASVYPEDNRPQNAMAGIGQASNRATPLQMAMVAAAIANNGSLMEPYMVDQLVTPNLNVIEQHDPSELNEAVSADTARQVQETMETVVEENSGIDRSQISDDIRIGGKTGTAQRGENNSEPPYAWFISYAITDEGSPVAVAVVIEDGGVDRNEISGSGLAAPIAMDVMAAVLADEQN